MHPLPFFFFFLLSFPLIQTIKTNLTQICEGYTLAKRQTKTRTKKRTNKTSTTTAPQPFKWYVSLKALFFFCLLFKVKVPWKSVCFYLSRFRYMRHDWDQLKFWMWANWLFFRGILEVHSASRPEVVIYYSGEVRMAENCKSLVKERGLIQCTFLLFNKTQMICKVFSVISHVGA